MKTVSINIPEIIASKMTKYSFIDWSEALYRELIFITSEREMVENILKKSTLTTKDADEISKKIKKGLFERHYQKAI